MESKNLIGKKIKIFYDDNEKVSLKLGVCTNSNEDGYELSNKEIIPKSRVIRIEILEND